jgi:hypothetical protein
MVHLKKMEEAETSAESGFKESLVKWLLIENI